MFQGFSYSKHLYLKIRWFQRVYWKDFSLKKVKIYRYYINFIKERECNYMVSFFKIFVLYTHVSRGICYWVHTSSTWMLTVNNEYIAEVCAVLRLFKISLKCVNLAMDRNVDARKHSWEKMYLKILSLSHFPFYHMQVLRHFLFWMARLDGQFRKVTQRYRREPWWLEQEVFSK